MTEMYYGYPYKIQSVAPSNLPQYQGGRLSTERAFLVQCGYAQDFALRMMGKLYVPQEFETPQLPAPYPIGSFFTPSNIYTSRLKMVAAGFRVESYGECCFTGKYEVRDPETDEYVERAYIDDATSLLQSERYFPIEINESSELIVSDDCKCICKVVINYDEKPWDCAFPDVDVLEHTALSIERSAGYEMFTLPNRNLMWADIVASEETDSQLKGDTYASVIIPKTDITVTWHNVPVKRLCEIEAHLTKYRGTVNGCAFTLLSECLCAGTDTPDESCDSSITDTCKFEAETILFVDWSEDKQARTRGFYKMNTTSLVLHFKQKRIEMDSGVAGWNHLYLDRSGTGIAPGPWQRVVVKRGDNWTEPLFKLKNFSNIFNLESADNVTCP